MSKICKYCREGEMVLRTSKFGQFWGCSRYPECAGTINIKEEKSDLEKEADKWLKNNSFNNKL